ncbi:uncharacterized protein TNCV_3687041 [Trichonephila clavipes]|nr:uncharacterized protein TNCV_3687041 [Trichonephila clavipes]
MNIITSEIPVPHILSNQSYDYVVITLLHCWLNHHTHFQHGLQPYPCKICTQQGIPNAYHWKLQCPFNQHQLRQTPFNCDPPLATNAVSQSSENYVGSQQIPNQENTPPLLRPLALHIENYRSPDTSHHCQV